MLDTLFTLARPLLHALDPEQAHELTLKSLEAGIYPRSVGPDDARLATRLWGLAFPNPLGMAAGFDKDARVAAPVLGMGLGFAEIGTVTPKPQAGNPRPRIFRLTRDGAIINRLGFNNGGVEALVRNVEKAKYSGVLGINIGKNKDTPNENAVDDYLFCLTRVYARASYITVNISSPNTQGLRDLQQEDTLKRFLGTLVEARERLASKHGQTKPMLLKIAPDLGESELDGIAEVALSTRIDGLICTNTTVDRSVIRGAPYAEETGGLSGKPLFQKATSVLRGMVQRLGDKIPAIGVGGILRGADAAEKFAAGASLVQFYSGMVYRGPALIGECVEAIRARTKS
jgi:dihydroorotate dehydrogenase